MDNIVGRLQSVFSSHQLDVIYKIANPRNDLLVTHKQSENVPIFANTSVPNLEHLEKV